MWSSYRNSRQIMLNFNGGTSHELTQKIGKALLKFIISNLFLKKLGYNFIDRFITDVRNKQHYRRKIGFYFYF